MHTHTHTHVRRLISDQIQENQNVMQHVSLLHVTKSEGIKDDSTAKLMVKYAALQKVASKSADRKAPKEVGFTRTHTHSRACMHIYAYAHTNTHTTNYT
jgi:hypothetical protein